MPEVIGDRWPSLPTFLLAWVFPVLEASEAKRYGTEYLPPYGAPHRRGEKRSSKKAYLTSRRYRYGMGEACSTCT